MRKISLAGAAMAASVVVNAPTCFAQEAVAEFYKKNKIDFYIAGAAGGALDLHGRMIVPYLTKHIPGNPTVLPKALPGAGGAKLANFMYTVAPKDGTAIANALPYIAVMQAVQAPEAQYDASRYTYLGSIAPINSVMATWNGTTPAKTFEDMKKTEVIVGATARSSVTYIIPTITNQHLGTKYKIVTGYTSTAPIMVAMERGEIHGRAADFEGILGPHPDWLEKKLVTLHFYTGLEVDPSMPGVPRLIDLATTTEQRELLEFISSGSALGRVYLAPPDVPRERAAALKKAFWDAVNDPDYKKFMTDRRLLVNPKDGAAMEKVVARTLAANPKVIDQAKDLFAMSE